MKIVCSRRAVELQACKLPAVGVLLDYMNENCLQSDGFWITGMKNVCCRRAVELQEGKLSLSQHLNCTSSADHIQIVNVVYQLKPAVSADTCRFVHPY